MRKFKEFIGIFTKDDDLCGKQDDEQVYVTIDLNSVIAWNHCEKGTVALDLQGGSRYVIEIDYSDFCKLMKDYDN